MSLQQRRRGQRPDYLLRLQLPPCAKEGQQQVPLVEGGGVKQDKGVHYCLVGGEPFHSASQGSSARHQHRNLRGLGVDQTQKYVSNISSSVAGPEVLLINDSILPWDSEEMELRNFCGKGALDAVPGNVVVGCDHCRKVVLQTHRSFDPGTEVP